MKAHEDFDTRPINSKSSPFLEPYSVLPILQDVQQKGNTPDARNEGARAILDIALDQENGLKTWSRWRWSKVAATLATPDGDIHPEALDAYRHLGTLCLAADKPFAILELKTDAIEHRHEPAFAAVTSALLEETEKAPAQTLREAMKRILGSGKPDHSA